MLPKVSQSNGYMMSDERRKRIGKVLFKKKKKTVTSKPALEKGKGLHIDTYA